MFKVQTKDFDLNRNNYSNLILPSSSLSSATTSLTATTTNLTPTALLSSSSSSTTNNNNNHLMHISLANSSSTLSSPAQSNPQTLHTLQSLNQSTDLMPTGNSNTTSGKLPRPPQRPPACRACKRRKSKCDFELPCSTCMLHNTIDSCAYDKLAIPRERKPAGNRSRQSGTVGVSNRNSELKLLRGRFSEAQKLIADQQAIIEAQKQLLRSKSISGRNLDLPRLNIEGGGQSQSNHTQTSDSSKTSDSPTPDTLADGLTQLVIDKATKSHPKASTSPPSPPPLPLPITTHSSNETGDYRDFENRKALAAQDLRELRQDVLHVLASHSNLSLARQMEITACMVESGWLGHLSSPSGCITPTNISRQVGDVSFVRGNHQIPHSANSENSTRFATRPSPKVHRPPTTILPTAEEIAVKNPEDLLGLFPRSLDYALTLLESYLGFVNLVHHLVDGEQARFELKLFYDLYMYDSVHSSNSKRTSNGEESPMPVSELMEMGWLSGTLAIFYLGSNSDKRFESNEHQALRKAWLDGALQGLAIRFRNLERPVDLTALRCACLVVWIYVLYGKDEEIHPAIHLNSDALYRACDELQLHRDPARVYPGISPRVAEDHRRVFYNLINTDWLFKAICGKTYSPISLDGHDVHIPRALEGRDEIPGAIDALGFRSLLMRQLRKLATMWIGSGWICEDQAYDFEAELDRLDLDLPGWCVIDVEGFTENSQGQSAFNHVGNPQAQAAFSQQIITNVQLCAVRVRFHSKLAVPSSEAPEWVKKSAPHHRQICIERAIKLLRLELLHLSKATRLLGHSGYPRFHPIVGGLTLCALMAKSCDRLERKRLYEELERFTEFIKSQGSLSQVTHIGRLAIETLLSKVKEEELAEAASRHQSMYQQTSLNKGPTGDILRLYSNNNNPPEDHSSRNEISGSPKQSDRPQSPVSPTSWAKETNGPRPLDSIDSREDMQLSGDQRTRPMHIHHYTSDQSTSEAPIHHCNHQAQSNLNPGCDSRVRGDTGRLDQRMGPSEPFVGKDGPTWGPEVGRQTTFGNEPRECKPISIDDFLSTFISGPPSANRVKWGEGILGQIGGARLDGGIINWGVAQDGCSGIEKVEDSRTYKPQGVREEWVDFETPHTGRPNDSIMSGLGHPVAYSDNDGSMTDGHSGTTASNMRSSSKDGRSNQPLSGHGETAFEDLLPTQNLAISARTFTPQVVTRADNTSSTPAWNPYVGLWPSSANPTHHSFFGAPSNPFLSASPPFSAPIGSSFPSFNNQSFENLQSSNHLSVSQSSGSGPGLQYPTKPPEGLDQLFDLTTGISPPSIPSATSSSFSSNSYSLSSSNSTGAGHSWKQEW